MSSKGLVEDFFRHQYGRLVSVLSRRVGLRHIELVEDAVQAALVSALDVWPRSGEPDNPAAWLFTVAGNKLAGDLRKRGRQQRILRQNVSAFVTAGSGSGSSAEETGNGKETGSTELNDALLHMLFVCCDDAIPRESQMVLALKTLCGFDMREIALRLFSTEANVYKRITRSRSILRAKSKRIDLIGPPEYSRRLPGVLRCLYLLFTEGYLSHSPDAAIRRELCSEAIRLTTLLANYPVAGTPETFALLALMHLHSSRMTARQDSAGGLLLLEEQDRALWDKQQIMVGLTWLAKAASGEQFSTYHAEAGIAAEHCLSPSFAETRWDKIAGYYEILEGFGTSAIHRLNRAVAVAEWKDADAGISLLENFKIKDSMTKSYLWSVVLADMYFRRGSFETAREYREDAVARAPTEALKGLLNRRFVRLMAFAGCVD